MTENEAIANLTYRRDCWIGLKYVNNNPEPYVSGVLEEAMQKGAEALEEIQQYRAIGTIEEFKALKEKAEPKKVAYQGEHEKCPSCGSFHVFGNYCTECGQKIDWEMKGE